MDKITKRSAEQVNRSPTRTKARTKARARASTRGLSYLGVDLYAQGGHRRSPLCLHHTP